MLEKLTSHIHQNFSFLENKSLLIAISGGIDSVVLTYLLHELKYNIAIAHCNFQLRGEASDLDEEFIKILGSNLAIPTYTIRFQTEKYSKENKLSTQIAARELRYDWFQKISKTHNFDYILTAHHADDNLETFLINLTRGTGLDGLTGIPPINKNIVRPLLIFSREEIEEYAVKNAITWRQDASNLETKYIRNKIRHKVIPILKELNPSILKTHVKTIESLKQSQQIISDCVEETSLKITSKQDGVLKIKISELLKTSNTKAYLYHLLKKYKFTAWDDIYALVYAESGKKVSTKSYTLLKDREFLLLLPPNEKIINESDQIIIQKGVTKVTNPIDLMFEHVIKKTIIDKNTIYVDKNLLNYPLVIRKWKEGDFFYPTGMTGKKKVNKYFKDEKLSILDKKNIWLLCSKENEIIWIIGKRQDRRFLPTKNTTQLLRLTI